MLVYVPPGKTIDYDKLNTILGRVRFYFLREVPMMDDPDHVPPKKAINLNQRPKIDRMIKVK